VFEMQEIVEGVVEIPFGTAGAAGWRACGAVRSRPPGRCRWERGRPPTLSPSRTPLRLGTFQLPKPIQQVGRHRTIGAGLHQGAEQVLGVLLDLHAVARRGVSGAAGRCWGRAYGA